MGEQTTRADEARIRESLNDGIIDPRDTEAFDRLLARAEAAKQWREEAWQCYVESGADPDGDGARLDGRTWDEMPALMPAPIMAGEIGDDRG